MKGKMCEDDSECERDSYCDCPTRGTCVGCNGRCKKKEPYGGLW